MSKALITGGAGALGSSLARMLLKKGYEVHVAEIIQENRAWRLKEIIDQVSYHWKSCQDITSKDVEDFDIIAHYAAQPDRPLGLTSPFHTLNDNVMALVRVLEACKDSGIKKFLFPGSGTTFTGVSEEQLPVTEETTPQPTNPYSASKYMAEVLCHTYRRCYDVPITVLRSGLVYGTGMRLDISIAQFIIKAIKDELICVRSPNATRTPTHLDDVMLYWEAVIDLEPAKVVGQIFHSVYGKEYPMIDIANMVSSILEAGSVIEGSSNRADT